MSSPITPNKGFPQTNYGVLWRNAHARDRSEAMIIPRRKYTFIVEINLNQQFINNQEDWVTNISNFITDGKLTAALVSIDRPQPSYNILELNSYNRKYNIPTKEITAKPTAVFHDDMASMASAFYLEYRNFYHNSALLAGVHGNNISNPSTKVFDVGLVGEGTRSDMSVSPSRGMKLRPTGMSNMIDSIIIYDLGGDTDSVNVDFFLLPTINQFTRESMSYDDRTGNLGMGFNFNYSEHFTLVGKNVSNYSDIIERLLYASPKNTNNIPNHANMGDFNTKNGQDTSLAPKYDIIKNFGASAIPNAVINESVIQQTLVGLYGTNVDKNAIKDKRSTIIETFA